MARLSLLLLIVINFALIFQPPCFEARKVLMNLEKEQAPSFKDNFVGISAFPSKEPTKLVIPHNDGDGKGHAIANNERQFTIHLAKLYRVLESYDSCGSAPSPGAGHC